MQNKEELRGRKEKRGEIFTTLWRETAGGTAQLAIGSPKIQLGSLFVLTVFYINGASKRRERKKEGKRKPAVGAALFVLYCTVLYCTASCTLTPITFLKQPSAVSSTATTQQLRQLVVYMPLTFLIISCHIVAGMR